MPSQDNMIRLQCTEPLESGAKCTNLVFSYKNKKIHKERKELKKYCKVHHRHTLHKETR